MNRPSPVPTTPLAPPTTAEVVKALAHLASTAVSPTMAEFWVSALATVVKHGAQPGVVASVLASKLPGAL